MENLVYIQLTRITTDMTRGVRYSVLNTAVKIVKKAFVTQYVENLYEKVEKTNLVNVTSEAGCYNQMVDKPNLKYNFSVYVAELI